MQKNTPIRATIPTIGINIQLVHTAGLCLVNVSVVHTAIRMERKITVAKQVINNRHIKKAKIKLDLECYRLLCYGFNFLSYL
jgi:hypothetical protein